MPSVMLPPEPLKVPLPGTNEKLKCAQAESKFSTIKIPDIEIVKISKRHTLYFIIMHKFTKPYPFKKIGRNNKCIFLFY